MRVLLLETLLFEFIIKYEGLSLLICEDKEIAAALFDGNVSAPSESVVFSLMKKGPGKIKVPSDSLSYESWNLNAEVVPKERGCYRYVSCDFPRLFSEPSIFTTTGAIYSKLSSLSLSLSLFFYWRVTRTGASLITVSFAARRQTSCPYDSFMSP